MTNVFARFVKDESGATAIEYGLIAALVAVAIIAGMTAVGTEHRGSLHRHRRRTGERRRLRRLIPAAIAPTHANAPACPGRSVRISTEQRLQPIAVSLW